MFCKSSLVRYGVLFCLCSDPAVGVSTAQELTETFVSKGITVRVGGYSPIRAEMSDESDLIKELPAEAAGGRFGALQISESLWGFYLVESEDGAMQELWVDSNQDRKVTGDEKIEWSPQERGGLTMYSGSAEVDLGSQKRGTLNLYRFDPNDPRRKQLASTLLYYSDFGYQYDFKLDGKEFSTAVSGSPAEGTRLRVDRDGNGRFSSRFETLSVGTPFNITGSSWVFESTELGLRLSRSDTPVEQLPLPPDLRPGKKALEFTATTMTGKEIQFPEAFRGRVVMLDFWATWCGPCIGEIPHMKEAYANWHEHGFDILGISFDQEGAGERVTKFLEEKEIVWEQVFEGKGWQTSLGMQHDVSAIPFVLLVDGDTGEILADASRLRGQGLSAYVGEVLKKKAGKPSDDAKPQDR